MIKTRFGLFETNSSSTHVMVLSPMNDTIKSFMRGESLLIEDCPEWLNPHVERSGSSYFINIAKLAELLKGLPAKKRAPYEGFLQAYINDPEDAEALARELNMADSKDEYVLVRDISTFGDGSELKIDVNGTEVIAIGAEVYDE